MEVVKWEVDTDTIPPPIPEEVGMEEGKRVSMAITTTHTQ